MKISFRLIMVIVATIAVTGGFAEGVGGSAQVDSASIKADSGAVRAGPTSAQTESVPVKAESASSRVDPVSSRESESAATQTGEDSESFAESGDAGDSMDDGDEMAEETVAEPERPKITPAIFGRPGRLDGIAAVVGDEIILHSELETYAFMRLSAMGGDPGQTDIPKFLRESLEDLVNNKVLIVRASGDSTIHVRNDEVESMLNNHINAILRQNKINTEQLDAQLRIQQGTTLARFKTEARRAIREQLLKQKLQQNFFFSTKISRRDVEKFFAQYADSLPQIGESFELLKLSLRLATPDSVRQAAFDKIRDVKKQLDAGGSFEELAKKYSESPEGASGGDLGYLTKGSTTEIVFEEHAFTLPVGRVSEPFETRLGYHILLVEEKRDQRVKLRQILVRHAPTEQQREATVARLDSLRQAVKSKAEFEAAARSISADAATRQRGGDMGWMSLLEMPSTVRNAVMNLETGQISAPVVEDNVLSVYMVGSRVDNRRLTLENDYAVIAEKARDILAQKQLLDNVKKWREKVFVDVRI